MWDGRRGDRDRAMMGTCYEAPLNAMVTAEDHIHLNMLQVRGGRLQWHGEGDWQPLTV